MKQSKSIQPGDRVTAQSKCWHDGEPVTDWPNPQYLGTVKQIMRIAGSSYAKIKYDSGRTDLENLSRLFVV